MKEILIREAEAGKRFDKFLKQYLSEAPSGFVYRMLRKKNIVLNGKRADGTERLAAGDRIRLFLSDETVLKFGNPRLKALTNDAGEKTLPQSCLSAYRTWRSVAPAVLYEDARLLLLNKPAGMLSQKAGAEDVSLNEWLVGYLLEHGAITPETLSLFRPSVCNRLDRNTSGIIVCAKTLSGAQTAAWLLRERRVRKLYRTVVRGVLRDGGRETAYLRKDAARNRVQLLSHGGAGIETAWRPLSVNAKERLTYLEVELATGKPHQIRAHFAAMGHPILGDPKYGDPALNRRLQKRFRIQAQLLHSFRMEFPETGTAEGEQEGLHTMSDAQERETTVFCPQPGALSGSTITAPLPRHFASIVRELFPDAAALSNAGGMCYDRSDTQYSVTGEEFHGF